MASSLQYRKKLKQISDELTRAELGRIKHLCAEDIPAGKRERARTAQELFSFMEELGLLKRDNLNYLIRILERIQRFDIIREFDIRASEGEIPRPKPQVKRDHSFRSLVDVLSESITSTELESLKQLCWDEIPGGRRQYLNDLQSFLAELEARGLLGKDNLDFLVELMDVLERRDLVNVVEIFKERKEVVRPSGAGGHVLTLGYQRVAACLPDEPMDVSAHLAEEVRNVRETTTTGLQPRDDFASGKVVVGANSMAVNSRPHHDSQQYDHSRTESGGTFSMASDDIDASSMRSMAPPSTIDSSISDCSQTQRNSLVTTVTDEDKSVPSYLRPSAAASFADKLADKMRRKDELSHMLQEAQKENRRVVEEKERVLREKEREVREERQRSLQAEERHEREIEEERRRREQELAVLRQQLSVSQTSRSRDALPCYSMKRNPRGVAVIISIENFQRTQLNLGSRQGTSVDAGHLERAFKNLSFDVLIHRDCTSSELVRVMTRYGQRDHSNYDCFVCCLLTHGKKDFIYGSDSLPVSVSEITSKVNGLACPSLNLKPKLFFIQACRGSGEDKGVETDSLPRIAQRDAQEQIKIPLGADFLIGYSTAPETVSFRSTTHGSWYICTLVAVLNEYAKEGMSLSDMLILVNHRLSQATTSEGLKQIPSPINQLTKRLVFTHTTTS